MTAMLVKSELFSSNPIDLAELVIMDRDWSFDRTSDGELIADASAVWGTYRVWFTWQEDMGSMTVACAFETKMPKQALPKVYALLAMVNEKLWIGHFDIASEDYTIIFRHTLLLNDAAGTNPEQLQELLDTAISECDRFYPAFQSVVWGGKSPAEAMQIAMFDTVAEA